jgi:hypothetical protein
MTGVHPPFQSNWKTWFEIPKMGVIARKPPIQSHAGYGSHSRNVSDFSSLGTPSFNSFSA